MSDERMISVKPLLLEKALRDAGLVRFTTDSHVVELRALLDAPAVSLADEGEMPAAQPQGDIITFPRELSDDLGELIAEKARVCGGGAFEIWETICEQFGTPADQPAPLAVAYQYRQRPLWRKDDNSGWMPWQDCSQEAHADYTASPDLHDWQYETRTLYVGPNQQ